MELGRDSLGPAVQGPAPAVILLDTNALIWLDQGHPRSRPLARVASHLYVSPASLLELQFLEDIGRLRLRGGTLRTIADDERWLLDEPPAGAWFLAASALGWTRDPFDRLIAAHAQIRGWRLATADTRLAARLGRAGCLEL